MADDDVQQPIDGTLTEDERRILELLALGRTGKEISHALEIPLDEVHTQIQIILVKLHIHEKLDPPDPPLAASSALAVPIRQDIPKHIGRLLPKKDRETD